MCGVAEAAVVREAGEIVGEFGPYDNEHHDRVDGAHEEPGDAFLEIDALVPLSERV